MNQIITQQPVEWDCVFTDSADLFLSESLCAQEKIDGLKTVIFSERGNLHGQSRNGKEVRLSAKTRALLPAQDTFIVEGEQGNRRTGDTGFLAFDLLSLEGEDIRHLPYDERLAKLWELGIPVVGTVFGELQKRKLYQKVLEQGGEGLVFKDVFSAYQPGETPKQLKLKNWKSDTFRVVSVDGRGIELATRAGVPAGRCPGFATPGQLVEVKHQGFTASGKLNCPVLIEVRTDLE